MSDRIYDVGETPILIPVPEEGAVLQNMGPGDVVVGVSPSGLVSTSEGALVNGAAITAVSPVWVVAAATAELKVVPRDTEPIDSRPSFQLAVSGAFQASTMKYRPGRAYYSRFIPETSSILTGIQVMPADQATGDPTVSFGIFDIDETTGELRRLALIERAEGRLNGTPYPDRISLAKQSVAFSPRLALQGGKPYYAAVCVADEDPTLTLASVRVGREALIESSASHLVLGAIQMLYDDSSIPSTLVRPTNIITHVPLIGLSYQRRITCLGDSMGYAYPRSLAAMLGRHAYVLNAGIGSDTIAHIDARFESAVTMHNPHDVVVLAGINDVQAERGASEVIAGLAGLYASVRAIGANVKAVTLAPWASYSRFSAAAETVRLEVNEWIRTSANVTYVDLESMGDDAAPPALQAGYTTDGIHPSGEGCTEIARQIFIQGYGGHQAPRLSTTAG